MANETKQAKHTPGPWQIGGAASNVKLRNNPTTAVFAPDSVQLIASTGGFMDNRRDGLALAEEQEANARLIAAAPDLLEALKLAYEAMEHMGDVLNGMDAVTGTEQERYAPAWEKTRAAIAKATGV